MNVRLVVSSVLALLLAHTAAGQQVSQDSSETGQTTNTSATAQNEFKQKVMHWIALQEATARKAESVHASDLSLSGIYEQLGQLYQTAAEWNKSEAAMEHAVSLLRNSPEHSGELASDMSELGCLHVVMGKFRESEKEEMEALKIRQGLGDRLEIARSWSDLGALNLVKQKFGKAKDFTQRALAEFVINEQATNQDRISVRFTLSETLCSLNECPSAIPLLQAALDEAKTTVKPNEFSFGLANFLLGYGYWKAGKLDLAGEHMERGVALMNMQLGWGHPVYLRVLKCYAQFLRADQRVEAANVVEREIRQKETVVDVHSIQTAQGMFGSNGLR
jgi:tetratricopeptide (TPR) repeat protein